MKCPECGNKCSDLRDICPSCHLDLRIAKRELKLPITNPNEDYEVLLAKITGKKTGLDSNIGSKLEKIGSFFRDTSITSPSASETKTAQSPSVQSKETKQLKSNDIEKIFDTLEREIKAIKSDSMEVSFESFEIGATHDPEQAAILFDLLAEEIENPDKVYIDEFQTSETRKVIAQRSEATLSMLEKRINTSVLSLRGSRPGSAAKTTAKEIIIPKVFYPNFLQYLISTSLDTLICLILASLPMLLMQGAISLEEDAVVRSLLTMKSFIGGFLGVFLLYPFLIYIVLGRSVGDSLAGIDIVDAKTKDFPDLPYLIVRAALLPLSLASGGGLLQLFGREALHDRLAGTQIIQSLDLEQDLAANGTQEKSPHDLAPSDFPQGVAS